MKHILFFVLTLVFNSYVIAQTGTIRGIVMDGELNEPLFSATAVIANSTNGAITDLDGQYEIQVEPGEYSLQFSYIGYQTITIEGVTVKANEVTDVDKIVLMEEVEMGMEVVVTAEAIRKNEVALINMKLKSAGMLDGISSDKIRQIGDGNVAEATKRVTGVTVEGGKYVYVRGLGDRYSKTTLNGVDIPGLDPDRNSIQMDIFPTNLINNVVISKNFTAELPADFTGGLLNIETKDFPEEKMMSISASTSYNPNVHFNNKFLSYQSSSTDFLGFDDGSRALPIMPGVFYPTPYNGSSSEQVQKFARSFNSNLAAQEQLSILDFDAGFSFGNQINLKNKAGELSNKKLGYIFSLTYKSDYKFYDDVEFGEYQREIDRDENELILANRQTGAYGERSFLLGAIGGIAYKTDRSKYKFTLMRIQNGESRAGKFDIFNDAGAVGQSGYEAVSDNLEYNQRSLTNMLINGKHMLKNGWEMDWRISPTYSTSDDPDVRKTAFSYDGIIRFQQVKLAIHHVSGVHYPSSMPRQR